MAEESIESTAELLIKDHLKLIPNWVPMSQRLQLARKHAEITMMFTACFADHSNGDIVKGLDKVLYEIQQGKK